MKKLFTLFIGVVAMVFICAGQSSTNKTSTVKQQDVEKKSNSQASTILYKPKFDNKLVNNNATRTADGNGQAVNNNQTTGNTTRSRTRINPNQSSSTSSTSTQTSTTNTGNEVVVQGISQRRQSSQTSSNTDNSGNNETRPDNFSFSDLFNSQDGNSSQRKIFGNGLVYDSISKGLNLFGFELANGNDVFNSIKNKITNRNNNQNTVSGPVNADDFSMSMVKKTADISAVAEKLFRQMRKSDATVKAINDKLVSNGAMALDNYFGREIQYEGMDGSLKTIKLYLQKYESGAEKYCLAHVEVSAKGSSQSLKSSACFVKDMNGEAQILYLQDCFGLIITVGTSANSMPCAGDFNWETLKGGVGNFL